MKVERTPTKPSFDPITITIETEEEAKAFWNFFNQSWKDVDNLVTKGIGEYKSMPTTDELNNFIGNVWSNFNREYRPSPV